MAPTAADHRTHAENCQKEPIGDRAQGSLGALCASQVDGSRAYPPRSARLGFSQDDHRGNAAVPSAGFFRLLRLRSINPMTLEEIKSSLEALDPAERGEVLAFLLRRRLLEDPSYRADVDRRSADGDSSHWLQARAVRGATGGLPPSAGGSSRSRRHVPAICF
jgi:hypothetical protein